MVYRSPFITETDEQAWTDCQFASGLMLIAEWTAGEAIHDRHGNTLDAKGLKRLRERLRVLSGDTVGGGSLEDLAHGVARRFPDLPPLPRTTAPGDPLRLSLDELWARLKAGHCAVLDGNPSSVKDPSSPLRSMQAKDDYDHAIFVHVARVSAPSSWTRSGAGGTKGAGFPRSTCASSPPVSRRHPARRTARS